ncbi:MULTISPECIES: MgtC/SapB family protein [Lactobacillus]|uniref:Mg2 transporter-C (MgtC) family protein n=1 Tax=Lactobacillus apis TaxID=303541 RepID=A0A0F4LYP6_9LACO|nr:MULTISPECIES: MgtC/SapB family protein [Lactobacillus]AWM73018.1 methyltransferase [Lactobacillus apis]KJY62681.1 Mg2 transporter-C (MgtC) family protein [Lactobacillus apis]MBC6361290.1 MgtC/SapB family protein [Lactobacillus apis]MBH9986166.1 MgtC/SapB family protein [Lactobacillus sp. M0390]MBI0022726.1 MgtC/SapB family protein [Lactobacillus sp. W8172]
MVDISPISAQLPWILRLVIASLCGALIGYERAIQRKSAGVRTHIVVAFSSALFMILSKYGFADLMKISGMEYDASRIAAQIVSGISFIGAGTILVKKSQISGLTTAAGVWATAAIGMAIGSGLYFLGIIATAILFIVQMIFHDDTIINKIIMHIRFNIQIEAVNKHGILKTIEKELSANHVENVSVKILYVSDEKIIFFVDGIINNNIDENNIIMALRKYPDIKRISYTSLGK